MDDPPPFVARNFFGLMNHTLSQSVSPSLFSLSLSLFLSLFPSLPLFEVELR